MSKCSLIVVRGDATADEETCFEYAQLSDLKFIELRHKKGSGLNEWSVRGFQGVTVAVRRNRDNVMTFTHELTKDREGHDCRALRPLVFYPVGRAKVLTSFIPDTPFNREKMSQMYYHGATWTVMDPPTHAEIRERAEVIEAEKPKGPTKDQVITSQAEEMQGLRDKLVMAEKERDEAKEQAKVVRTASRSITELTQEQRDSIREIVHTENAEVIAKLKEQSPEGWREGKKYRDLIEPLVEKRERETLEQLNADDTGADNRNPDTVRP